MNLTDIPSMLRALADEAERGEVQLDYVIVVYPSAEKIVEARLYGPLPDRFQVAGLLQAGSSKAASGAWL
jgi:hypothetical protein